MMPGVLLNFLEFIYQNSSNEIRDSHPMRPRSRLTGGGLPLAASPLADWTHVVVSKSPRAPSLVLRTPRAQWVPDFHVPSSRLVREYSTRSEIDTQLRNLATAFQALDSRQPKNSPAGRPFAKAASARRSDFRHQTSLTKLNYRDNIGVSRFAEEGL